MFLRRVFYSALYQRHALSTARFITAGFINCTIYNSTLYQRGEALGIQ